MLASTARHQIVTAEIREMGMEFGGTPMLELAITELGGRQQCSDHREARSHNPRGFTQQISRARYLSRPLYSGEASCGQNHSMVAGSHPDHRHLPPIHQIALFSQKYPRLQRARGFLTVP
jgi:hypothetical protein